MRLRPVTPNLAGGLQPAKVRRCDMKILIATDGSDYSKAAVNSVAERPWPQGSEVKIISAMEIPYAPATETWVLPNSYYSELESVARGQAEAAVKDAVERIESGKASGLEIITKIISGSAREAILDEAERWDADLIVLGSHGHTALGRFFFGSVSQKVLHEARRSVRVARGRIEEPGTPVRLIIGVDGSKGAEAAVEAVAVRKWPAGSEARIVNATWATPQITSNRGLGPIITWIAEEKARVNKMIDEAVGKLRASGLRTEVVVKEEEPKRLLIIEAESWGADCIFVGARGMGRIERFLLGSVSSAVAARAHCSVEVVYDGKER